MAISQQDIQQVLNAIKAESQGVRDLEEVTSLNGVNSLPAVKDEKLVSVPVALLQKPATDAAATANAAAESANAAAQSASTAAGMATEAKNEANAAASTANDAAEKARQAATQYENTAKAAMNGASARFAGFVESGTILSQTTEQAGGSVVYVTGQKLFAYSVGGQLYNSWSVSGILSP